MKHRVNALAALVAGGWLLLGAGQAQAHAGEGEEVLPLAGERAAQERLEREASRGEKAPRVAAKCRCASAADCTCKRGECKCPRCRKSLRPVIEGLKGRRQAPAPAPARVDASAGLLI